MLVCGSFSNLVGDGVDRFVESMSQVVLHELVLVVGTLTSGVDCSRLSMMVLMLVSLIRGTGGDGASGEVKRCDSGP